MSNKKMTMGLIVGNRGFFPAHLANSGREEMTAVLQKAGMDVVVLDAAGLQVRRCDHSRRRQTLRRSVQEAIVTASTGSSSRCRISGKSGPLPTL